MVRRLTKSAAILLTITCVVFAVPPAEFLEALTANLNTLITTQGTLVEGDKTFSNFSFNPVPVNVSSQPGATLTLPDPANITVTSSGAGSNVITLSFAPFGLAASVGGGVLDVTAGLVSFGFDVNVSGSDVISAVSIDASVVQNGPFATASADANISPLGGPSLGLITSLGIGTLSTPALQGLSVGATAGVLVEGTTETAGVDEVVFTFDQTTPTAPVPEAGSLTLMLGGVGMLLARRLYRRRG